MGLHLHPPADGLRAVDYARQVLVAEATALREVADRLDESFDRVVDLLAECPGRVAVSGVGKSADVAGKIVGTLNSTGTRAYFLDPTKAMHGDLGMVAADDVALVLSHSGESEEIVRLLGPLADLAAAVIGITGNGQSTLARLATAAIVYGPVVETCPLTLAPSTSTTVMLALGDALAFVLSDRRRFSAEDFARYHPAGSLGRQLTRVEVVMRRGPDLRLAPADETVRQVFAAHSHSGGRRTGAVMLTDSAGRLCGLFTDSDLARLFERRHDAALDRPVREVMTANPLTVPVGARVAEALDLMRRCKISELPVIDTAGRPAGLLDITDLIGLRMVAGQGRQAA
ncbi:MAG TPA: KpsF/GutQ family sugar-phosphate isomerase [Gemmataceae bacterium]|jgi:arabinose-5-phosphate isomerase|nr:KpsF/GutQ family sugar-phosphate isomerase [Gemmataceae bacterium]